MINFVFNAIALGIGLAMDAFSVSLANGLYYPKMENIKRISIALTFGVFQFLMPLIGWFLVHTAVNVFKSLKMVVPWIGIILLSYIGIKMIIEGLKNKETIQEKSLSFKMLFIQGVATSIDALSVGFTNSNYDFKRAVVESIIIGLVTFIICIGGLYLGNKVGDKFQNKATLLGGSVLLIIAIKLFIEIFI